MASALDQMHYESMISPLPLLRSQLENNLLRQKKQFHISFSQTLQETKAGR